MDIETKEFLLGFENRLSKLLDEKLEIKMTEQNEKLEKALAEQDKKLEKALAEHRNEMTITTEKVIDDKIQKAIEKQTQEIARELHAIMKYIDKKFGMRYTRVQKNIEKVDNKLDNQTKKLSNGFKEIANSIDNNKIAI